MTPCVEVGPGLLGSKELGKLLEEYDATLEISESGWLRITPVRSILEPTQDFGITEQL